MMSLGKSRDTTLASEGPGGILPGSSWEGFPHFYKWVFTNETFPVLDLEIVCKTVMRRFAGAIW